MYIYFFIFSCFFGRKEKDFVTLYESYIKDKKSNKKWEKLFDYYVEKDYKIGAINIFMEKYRENPDFLDRKEIKLTIASIAGISPFVLKNINLPDSALLGLELSPDNKYIAYAVQKGKDVSNIRLLKIEDSSVVDITTDSMFHYPPIFDSKGEFLYFITRINRDYSIVERYGINNGVREKVLEIPETFIFHISLSPDDRYLTFQARKGKWDDWEIYLYDRETGDLVQLTDNIFADLNPTFTKSSDYIYFSSNMDKDFNIYKYHIKKRKIEPVLTIPLSNEADFDISRDERYLIFLSDMGVVRDLYLYDTEQKRYWAMNTRGRPVYLNFSSDGKYVMSGASQRPGEISLYYYNIDNLVSLEYIYKTISKNYSLD